MYIQFIDLLNKAKQREILKQAIKEKKVVLTGSREDVIGNFEYFTECCFALLHRTDSFGVAISSDMMKQLNSDRANYIYTAEEFEKISKLNHMLKEFGMTEDIRFNEYKIVDNDEQWENAWRIDQVEKANQNIDKIANRILELDLSPVEKVMYAHTYITRTFPFKKGNPNKMTDNNIVGAFNLGDIVCAGYSSMMKAILERVADPNIDIEIVSSQLYNSFTYEGSHAQCLIKIKDDKYNISGHYMNDCCWDTMNEDNPTGRGYAHFLFPVRDLLSLNNRIYYNNYNEVRFDAIISDIELERASQLGSDYIQELKERIWEELLDTHFPYVPNVVSRVGSDSTPIPYETYPKVLRELFAKCGADFGIIDIDREIDEKMRLSKINGMRIFDKGIPDNKLNPPATSEIVKRAYRELEISKDAEFTSINDDNINNV